MSKVCRIPENGRIATRPHQGNGEPAGLGRFSGREDGRKKEGARRGNDKKSLAGPVGGLPVAAGLERHPCRGWPADAAADHRGECATTGPSAPRSPAARRRASEQPALEREDPSREDALLRHATLER